jgi:hypothetical protein
MFNLRLFNLRHGGHRITYRSMKFVSSPRLSQWCRCHFTTASPLFILWWSFHSTTIKRRVVQVSLHHWSSLLSILLAGGAGVTSPLFFPSIFFAGGWCRCCLTTATPFFLFCWRVVQVVQLWLLHCSCLRFISFYDGAGVATLLLFPFETVVLLHYRCRFSNASVFVFFCCTMVQLWLFHC